MRIAFKKLVRYLPLGLGLAILAVLVPLVPWPKVLPYLARLSPGALAVLVGCSALYYAGRILRYWLMLRLLGAPADFGRVALACLVAQPVAVLPGGELYRSAMLKRYANVSLRQGVPSVFAQSLAENVGLLAIALVGVVVLQRYGAVLLGLAAVFGAIWAYIRWQNSHTSHRLVNKLPWVEVEYGQIKSFLVKNKALLTGRNLWLLVAAALVSTLAGVAMVWIAAGALGAPLNGLQAAIAYALPVMLEAVSFLPGGFGVHEQGSVGVLAFFGVGLPAAVAITIIVRLFTLGAGFGYGFAAMLVARLARVRRYD
jgi:glycosyltransferase 2 family protein